MVGGAGAGEQRPRVVAAEQSRRQVHHVPVDQPGLVEGVRPRRRRPRRAPGARPARRARRAPRPGSPCQLQARVHLGAGWAPGPARPAAGSTPSASPAGRRTVSAGSSARTVPAPTSMASLSARSRWASARAAGPVIQWLEPSGAAVRAVERGRQLEHHVGPTGAAVDEVGRQLARRPRRPHADLDLDAGRPQAGDALAGDLAGRGPRAPRRSGATPASMTASAQGPVRPWCEQGSSVT